MVSIWLGATIGSLKSPGDMNGCDIEHAAGRPLYHRRQHANCFGENFSEYVLETFAGDMSGSCALRVNFAGVSPSLQQSRKIVCGWPDVKRGRQIGFLYRANEPKSYPHGP